MLIDWFQNIEFAYKWVFAFLILLPVIIWEYARSYRKQQAAMIVTTTHLLKGRRVSIRARLRHLPFVLRGIAMILFVFAMARPQQRFSESQATGDGIDIVLCFDISGSMTADDLPPNRLEAAKEVATNFVNGRRGDQIGITIFSNQSFTLCPLTIDHNTVLAQIKNIQSGYLKDEGTAIGSGLATSVDRLRAGKSKSKVIILLTDGVDFGGAIPPDIAKEMAKLYKIKVYTIGVGAEKEVNEVINTPTGPVAQHKRLEYNESLLKELAQYTGGQYFHALDKTSLQKIYGSINTLEKSRIQVTSYEKYADKYRPFLIAALIVLLMEVIIRYVFFRRFP
jgi:Ca-activated chloride channel family protein